MLTAYIQAAMKHAKYEILEDQTYYGEIPGFQGVYANMNTLESCREELQSVLEGFGFEHLNVYKIILGLKMGHPFPEADGLRPDVIVEQV